MSRHRERTTGSVRGSSMSGAYNEAEKSRGTGFKWPSFTGILKKSKRRYDDD